MKVIIAGSRGFHNYSYLKKRLDGLLSKYKYKDITIVSGAANGADKLGERYAIEKGCKVDSHPADWDKFGKSAGYIRNEQMAKNADALVAFWDGESKGTMHMINLAKKYNLKVKVIKYNV